MDDLLEKGIATYKAGKRDEARKIFIALVKQEPDNERAWGWMYMVANDDKERIYCMKQALRINPKNEKASQILAQLLEPPITSIAPTSSTPSIIQPSPSTHVSPPLKQYNSSIIGLWGSAILLLIVISGILVFMMMPKKDFLGTSLGSMESPFPFGSPASLTYTLDSQVSEYSLSVLDVIRGDQANAIVYNANMFNQEPPVGTSWMLVRINITLNKGSAFSLNSADMAIVSEGQFFAGVQFGVCCTQNIGYPELNANIAVPGTSVEGWIVRPVILNDNKPLLALNINPYKPDLTKGLFFALYR
jgi:hypothetical protein